MNRVQAQAFEKAKARAFQKFLEEIENSLHNHKVRLEATRKLQIDIEDARLVNFINSLIKKYNNGHKQTLINHNTNRLMSLITTLTPPGKRSIQTITIYPQHTYGNIKTVQEEMHRGTHLLRNPHQQDALTSDSD